MFYFCYLLHTNWFTSHCVEKTANRSSIVLQFIFLVVKPVTKQQEHMSVILII